MFQGISGGLINPQVSGLIQQMFRGEERGRAFGALGTTVGLGTALGPLAGGALIALGGPDLGWRLVFFINIPVGIAVILLGRRFLPQTPATGRAPARRDRVADPGCGDVLRAVRRGRSPSCSAGRSCCSRSRPRLLLFLFWRRERRLTREELDPLVDLRLFRRPSYTSGVVLALAYFPAMAGLPLVLALYFQRGLGFSALHSALGVTAFAVGSAVSAQLAGRFVTRIGRPLIVGGHLDVRRGGHRDGARRAHAPDQHAILVLAGPLFVMGLGSGAVITPNQALTLADVDPVAGSTAGGVLQTAQRVGLAIGQAVIGAVFFSAVVGTGAGVVRPRAAGRGRHGPGLRHRATSVGSGRSSAGGPESRSRGRRAADRDPG